MKALRPLPGLTFRPMRRKDAAEVARMMSELQAFHGDACRTKAKIFVEYCLGPNRLSSAWVAVQDKRLLGFAITKDWMNFVRAHPTRTLDLFFIDAAYRQQKVGAAFMAWLAARALAQGFTRLDTSAAPNNKGANAFYPSLGFDPIPFHSNRYGLDGPALKRLARMAPKEKKNK